MSIFEAIYLLIHFAEGRKGFTRDFIAMVEVCEE